MTEYTKYTHSNLITRAEKLKKENKEAVNSAYAFIRLLFNLMNMFRHNYFQTKHCSGLSIRY